MIIKRPIITFDVDGVLAEFVQIKGENPLEFYPSIPPIDPSMPTILNQVAERADVYIITSRSFPGALRVTKRWLKDLGVNTDNLAGIICNIGGLFKPIIVTGLGAMMHFDDDPHTIAALAPIGRGLLINNSASEINQKAIETLPTIKDWKALVEVLTKTGLVQTTWLDQNIVM